LPIGFWENCFTRWFIHSSSLASECLPRIYEEILDITIGIDA